MNLVCVVCHSLAAMIFAVHKTSVTAFCGPAHAAQCGLVAQHGFHWRITPLGEAMRKEIAGT